MQNLGYSIDLMEWGSQNQGYPQHEEAYLAWTEDVFEILNENKISSHYWDFSGYNSNDGCLLLHNDWLTLSTRGEIWAQYCLG